MVNSKTFLGQTVKAASFAFREYFRPLVEAGRSLKSSAVRRGVTPTAAGNETSLEDAKAIVRERLAQGRQDEKLLLMQGMIAALASLLALAISLMRAFDLDLAVMLAVLVPVSTFALWVALRLVQTREEIVELKTIRWLMKSLDEETGARVVKQVLWGNPERKRRARKDKNPQ